MGLHLEHIAFRDFRSWERLDLDGLGALTVLVGANAAGKTNVVEGIELACALQSFRSARLQEMVSWEAKEAHIEARLTDGVRLLDLSLDLKEGRKACRLNGKPRRAADIKGTLPAVSFTPDDLDLAKGSSGVRRAALDSLGSQLSRNYHAVRRDFEKMLRQKNRLLKEGASPLYLSSVDEVFATVGAQLCFKRAEVLARLRPHIQAYYRAISGGSEEVGAVYVPSWRRVSEGDGCPDEGRDERGEGDALAPPEGSSAASVVPFSVDEARTRLLASIDRERACELARGRAVVGPHADAIAFTVDGRSAASFASQGQQRSLVLSFKLAEVALVREVLGQQPVLLLDDVMSELDAARRTALVDFILDDIQTFVTTTDLSYFDERLLARARVIELGKEGGRSYVVSDSAVSVEALEHAVKGEGLS